MKKLRVWVRPTQVEARDGCPGSTRLCPYALAARRRLTAACSGTRVSVSVGPAQVSVWCGERGLDPGRFFRIPLPGRVSRRINDFDNGDRTSPWPGFYLTVEVPA